MEITWYGHSCFRLKDRNITVITDPYDKTLGLPLPRPKAEIVTISHDSPHYNHTVGVKGEFKTINSPGEYEIGGVFVTVLNLQPATKGSKHNQPVVNNNVFVFYMDGIVLCHLGNLTHVPTQNQVEDMDNIDVLMVPVGGHDGLTAAQAAELVSLIEPYIVIPMHYELPGISIKLDPVSKFLTEMGITKAETVASLKLAKPNLPEETQIVLLEAKS
jgi:L-ascorbate metabolism protein UlaG (beta-lactamase superfamily)